MSDMRVVFNVTFNIQILMDSVILPGLPWSDIDGKPFPPESKSGERWHLFLTDFRLDTFKFTQHFLEQHYSQREDGTVRKPRSVWMRYHGLSLYALSTILATNFVMPSEEKVKGMETACGRGVYTTRNWEKALGYAIPHFLPGSDLIFRAVALLIIPGDASVGGAADWVHTNTATWIRAPTGGWTKEGKWKLQPRRPTCMSTMDAQLEDAIGNAADLTSETTLAELRKRKDIHRDPSRGEIPWTNVMDDGYEEQSSVAHVAGFFLTCQTAAGLKKTMMPSRKDLGFTDWDTFLEPMIARPFGWDELSPNLGSTTFPESSRSSSTIDV